MKYKSFDTVKTGDDVFLFHIDENYEPIVKKGVLKMKTIEGDNSTFTSGTISVEDKEYPLELVELFEEGVAYADIDKVNYAVLPSLPTLKGYISKTIRTYMNNERDEYNENMSRMRDEQERYRNEHLKKMNTFKNIISKMRMVKQLQEIVK